VTERAPYRERIAKPSLSKRRAKIIVRENRKRERRLNAAHTRRITKEVKPCD
jgi:hypothetical protein